MKYLGRQNGDCTAHFSYSRGIQDGWLACPSPHLLAKSTNNLGHPILSLHTPAIVKVFRMVGWPDLPSTCLLKVRKFQSYVAFRTFILSSSFILCSFPLGMYTSGGEVDSAAPPFFCFPPPAFYHGNTNKQKNTQKKVMGRSKR